MNVQEYLREHQATFHVIDHPAAYSAQRVAEAVHVSGDWVAKSVVLKAAHGFCYYLIVVPASARVDLDKLRQAMGVVDIELATEDEIAALCRDCEVGALPPFGSQHGMETIVDESLTWAEEIVFEGNSHEQAIRMKYRDFYELEHPLVLGVATHA
ncbi:MAG TPA: YbaK/EbsC family protein [Gemmataceae bacterium]|nr:YbaK/EbsC family protein [Pirellulales bacterium]HZZ77377.1 YbaK/EbsC family protein [Gemmataceae bacterium]